MMTLFSSAIAGLLAAVAAGPGWRPAPAAPAPVIQYAPPAVGPGPWIAAQLPEGNGRMFWVGSDGTDPFTDAELEYLVETASTILIAQFYAGFDIDAHHDLAWRVKALDPGVRIFGYMSATLIRPRFEWMQNINNAWILRDRQGSKIVHKFQPDGVVSAYYADISNVNYRGFLVDVAQDWMAIAPYDGIVFDASNYVHGDVDRTFLDRIPPHPRANTKFSELLTQRKMNALNDGLEALFVETKAGIGSRLIAWNGFWRKGHTINRSLDLLPLGDIALTERWSIRLLTDPNARLYPVLPRNQILEDLGIVADGIAIGKDFFLKDTIHEDWYETAGQGAVQKVARFGWGMYMMAHTPGRTSYGFSPGPAYSQNVGTDPILLDVPSFGWPIGPYQDLGSALARDFEHGLVYLNPITDPVTVQVPYAVELLHGLDVPDTVPAGGTVTIGGRDAVFFMRSP